MVKIQTSFCDFCGDELTKDNVYTKKEKILAWVKMFAIWDTNERYNLDYVHADICKNCRKSYDKWRMSIIKTRD